jgi:excinuclease ABC subunit C
MVKNERHETSSLLNQTGQEILLETKSKVFRLIQQIQEEVHRFAITFHRQQRAKSMTLSELDNIPGVGPKRKFLLFRSFGSIEAIKKATSEELKAAGLPGNVAQKVQEYFSQIESPNL